MILSNSNSKLGPNIYTFNLPAIDTCPGASELCKRVCYGLRDLRLYPSIAKSHAANLEMAKSKGFVPEMIRHIKHLASTKKVTAIRLHSYGDFFSVKYVRDWCDIVSACSEVKFYAYTKSWRLKRLLPQLDKLGKLDNMVLWASYDKETGLPPARWLSVYMAMDATDVPAGKKPGVVFRVSRSGYVPTIGGSPVCIKERAKVPHEFAVKVKSITCATCGLCLKRKK